MSSQEQRPIRSRRELRRAREEQAQASAPAVGTDDAGSAASAEAKQQAQAKPAPAQPAQAKPAQASPAQAQSAQAKPAPAKPAEAKPAGASPAQAQPAEAKSAQQQQANRPAGVARNRRAADAPVDAVSSAAAERSSQIRARDRAALRAIKELADKEEQLSGGGPPTRRQLRLQQLQAEMATSANPIVPAAGSTSAGVAKESVKGISAPGAPAKPGAATSGTATPAQEKPGLGKPAPEKPGSAPASGKPSPGGDRADAAHTSPAEADMSVEQALAVRELIAAQVQNQTSKLEHIAEQDPLAVDPEVLAQQIALAERAAVLNKRAAAKQRLAEQARQEKSGDQGKPAAAKQSAAKSPTLDSGPSTANNLAMVTPLEFVKVPGVERPVMKRPSTTFVPLVTSPNPTTETKQGPARNPRGRAGVLARAEAVARNARKRTSVVESGQDTERAPVSASTAYGLDPLDAGTAGLARAQRNRLLQYGVLAAGLIALIVGIIMITSG
ncbi:hypothetical protein [Paenarthrobacter ureafaciens]|uniref:hypothetical protein n=1 Tax=Paenarthrobacter ureafaciens TaxID=37931 RepID=UPI001FB5434D|nr:hypothetical protein [Paenarthrobacter ureafaciens]UOD79740.1 hypothetical protein MQZ73_11275 [Paenarthrobacter ureafaciens]WNZ04918.1 hypothetical protein PVT25_05115 [Paenarthrobacter ureafaciens]